MSEENISLTPKTRISLNIAGIAVIILATWKENDTLTSIDVNLANMQETINEAAIDRWTSSDMERWVFETDRSNRESDIKLNLPSPRDPHIRVRPMSNR